MQVFLDTCCKADLARGVDGRCGGVVVRCHMFPILPWIFAASSSKILCPESRLCCLKRVASQGDRDVGGISEYHGTIHNQIIRPTRVAITRKIKITNRFSRDNLPSFLPASRLAWGSARDAAVVVASPSILAPFVASREGRRMVRTNAGRKALGGRSVADEPALARYRDERDRSFQLPYFPPSACAGWED